MTTARKRLFGLGMIALLVLAVLLGITKPNPLQEKHQYFARFDNAQGLGAIDRDVRIAGAKVGTVGEVAREGDDVRVELVLFEDFAVHEDARADMRPHTLFEGSNFIDFFPGSPSAPVIEEGSEIPIEQTSNYVTLDRALRVLRPEIRESLRELAEVGAETFKGKAIAGVQRTLKAAPDLAEDLAPAARAFQGPERRELAGAISGIAETVDAVAEEEDELIPLAQRINRTNAALAVDGGAPLDATLVALPGALRELRDSAPALSRLIDRLDRFSGEITPALPDFALALEETTPVLAKAIPVLRGATPLIRDTRFLTSALGKAGPGLITMFELLEQPLVRFGDTLGILNAPSALGAPNVRQLVAGAFTAADAAFGSYQTPAQNPSNPGHQWRGNLYFSPNAFGGLTGALGNAGLTDVLGAGASSGSSGTAGSPLFASCADVEQVSAKAARLLEAQGGCR